MHQTQWLVNSIRDSFKHEWNLGQYITIDETMVKYKIRMDYFYDELCRITSTFAKYKEVQQNDTTKRHKFVNVQFEKNVLNLWKDRQLDLLSTHAPPIIANSLDDCNVPKKNSTLRLNICTSSIVQEYMKHMRGVNVVDHLQGNYSTQEQLYKWWHKVFFSLWDLTKVNIYIIYCKG